MNWGTKLFIGMAIFMMFIISMGVYMFTVKDQDGLIEDNYYEKGIQYDEELAASNRVAQDREQPQIIPSPTQLIIKLKHASSYDFMLLNAGSSKADESGRGNTVGEENLIIINRGDKPEGIWFLKLRWKSNQKEYIYKQTLRW